MANDNSGAVGFLLSSSDADLGRAIYDMQRRIGAIEAMDSFQFKESVMQISQGLPPVGINSYV